MSDLDDLRAEINELDRRLLELLNRRLELVASVRGRKDEAGERWIDADREAELLRELAEANPGPLSERGVTSIFSAVLDVLKQEVAASRPARQAPQPETADAGVTRIAIVGTGLLGASVGFAARRAGVRVHGVDTDAGRLAEAVRRGAVETEGSLAEAELVVVAVPVGAAPAVVREALAAAPGATVTDVGSTKRAVAEIEDARFVPGHPLAGGATGGPARATADLFSGATWFLTPTPASDPDRIDAVERFVRAIGAAPVRVDAAEHDRVLALTSHLPHALANALMLTAARDEATLAYAGAAFREMTRVAGANPAVWADIFLENADELTAALTAFRDALDELAGADRAALESSIGAAAEAHARLDAFAYRTEAAQLHRIRVRVPDRPGVLARITQSLGAASINIEDFELRHVSPEYGGVLVILVAGAETAQKARDVLRREGYAAA